MAHWVMMNIGYCEKHQDGCISYWDPMRSASGVARAGKRSYQRVLLAAVSAYTGIPSDAAKAIAYKTQGGKDGHMCGWRTVNYALRKTTSVVLDFKRLGCTHVPPDMTPQNDLSNKSTRKAADENLEFMRDFRQVSSPRLPSSSTTEF